MKEVVLGDMEGRGADGEGVKEGSVVGAGGVVGVWRGCSEGGMGVLQRSVVQHCCT